MKKMEWKGEKGIKIKDEEINEGGKMKKKGWEKER